VDGESRNLRPESECLELVPLNAHGAMHFPVHLILELWRYADLMGAILHFRP
jgi:hypothetical protein